MIPEKSEPPRNIYGVDFSGAADAGKRIWIASAVVPDGVLRIERCFRGDSLLHGGSGRARSVSQHVLDDPVCEFRTGFSTWNPPREPGCRRNHNSVEKRYPHFPAGSLGAYPTTIMLEMGLCDERLDGIMFYAFERTRILVEQRRRKYNTTRPHSPLGYPTPGLEAIVWPRSESTSSYASEAFLR